MKKYNFIYIFALVTSTACAQVFEIGLFAGGSNYVGDIGPSNYINPNFPAVGGMAKFNFTPQINFRGTLIYTQLNAKDSKSDSDFRVQRDLNMVNNILEASGGIEFNFFKYSMNQVGFDKTPYIIAKVSVVNYRAFFERDGDIFSKRKFAFAPTAGLGYKIRIAENLAMSVESSFRYLFNDDIDATTIRNIDVGNVDSNDWYIFTGFTITYGFGRPGCYKGSFF
ncbi:MAG: hypothetical protein HKN90_04605 [Flavobacteriaceae bacterium]|nr:hypothetical protein [Flavobacteriaceae bacterium]